eukprot:3816378-Prymnesium_polylepis.1
MMLHCLSCCFQRRLPSALATASPPRRRPPPTRHCAAATSGYRTAQPARSAYARRPPRLRHNTTVSTAHSRTARSKMWTARDGEARLPAARSLKA